MIQIATARMRTKMRRDFDWNESLHKGGFEFYTGTHKAVKIPGLLAEILDDYRHGNTGMNLNLSTSSRLAWLLRKLVRRSCYRYLGHGTFDQLQYFYAQRTCRRRCLEFPALGFMGYVIAFIIVLYVLIKHFIDQINGK